LSLITLARAKKYTDQANRHFAANDLIYGVTWDKGSSPKLTRTDAAVGMVANPGLDMMVPKNDFDFAQIYRDIKEVQDEQGNVFIRIPKFYIKKVDSPGFKSWQISRKKYPGFYLPWCFWDFGKNRELPHIDVGKYKASLSAASKLESKAGVLPLVSRHIVDFRTFARNNNVDGLLGYQQLDIHVVDVLRTLFFVEFATLDSQSVMQGLTTGGAAAQNGFSNGIAATSGSNLSNADGKNPLVYRGIESLYGDVWQFVDGVNITEYQAWVAKNAEDYASNVFAAPYEQLGYVNANTDGYVIEMGFDPNFPFIELAKTVGGNSATYYSDYYYRNTGQRIARFGGSWGNGASAGVSCWALSYSSSGTYSDFGGRLLKKPL